MINKIKKHFSFSSKVKTNFIITFIIICGISIINTAGENDKTMQSGQNEDMEIGRYNFEIPDEVVNALFRNNGLFREFDPKDELKEKRNMSSKHFKNPDGSITTIIGAGSVHYWENGVWKTILSHILPNKTQEFTDYDYAAVHNAHKIFFPGNPGKPIVTKIKNEIYEDWGQPAMVWLDSNANILSQVPLNTSAVGVPDKDLLTYSNIFPHTDAEIRNSITTKKLNYILRDSSILANKPAGAAYLAFRETIKTSSTWKLSGTNSNEDIFASLSSGQLLQDIMFMASGKAVLEIKAPLYYEYRPLALGPDTSSIDSTSHYEGSFLVRQSDFGYDIYTLVPVHWLTHPNRDFPLVIDPTTNYYPGGTWPTHTAYRANNSGSWACAVGLYENRAYYYDISYGWIDDSWPTSNPYLDGYASFNISALSDNSCISSVTYYWYHYYERNCGTDISLKFGMVQFNEYLANQPSCDIDGIRIRNNNNYYSGTGYNSNGWKSRSGSIADLVAALPGDQITLGWAYNGGDDCCTCCIFCTINCCGNDGNYHHVYGYQSAANKPYVRVTYQPGPPAGFDKVWNGSASTSWTNGNNWCPTGKPNSTHEVYIPNTTNKPTLSTNEFVNCITIYSDGGAVVTITGTGTLNVGNASCPTFP